MAATRVDDLSLWLIMFLLVMFVYSDNIKYYFGMADFIVTAGIILGAILAILTIIEKLWPKCNIAIGKLIILIFSRKIYTRLFLRLLSSRQRRPDIESQAHS